MQRLSLAAAAFVDAVSSHCDCCSLSLHNNNNNGSSCPILGNGDAADAANRLPCACNQCCFHLPAAFTVFSAAAELVSARHSVGCLSTSSPDTQCPFLYQVICGWSLYHHGPPCKLWLDRYCRLFRSLSSTTDHNGESAKST